MRSASDELCAALLFLASNDLVALESSPEPTIVEDSCERSRLRTHPRPAGLAPARVTREYRWGGVAGPKPWAAATNVQSNAAMFMWCGKRWQREPGICQPQEVVVNPLGQPVTFSDRNQFQYFILLRKYLKWAISNHSNFTLLHFNSTKLGHTLLHFTSFRFPRPRRKIH